MMRWSLLVLGLATMLAACATMTPRNGFTGPQMAALKTQGFSETPRGWELSVADRLLFPSDDAKIDGTKSITLERLGKALGTVGIARLRVEGHADSTGSANHNLALSQARANAVADVLAQGPIARAAIEALGLGETLPVESNATAEGRAENRRVVIIVPPQR